MTNTVFVTHFNKEYAIRGCAMIQSLRTNSVEDLVVVFAHDELSMALLQDMQFENVEAILLEKLEANYQELQEARKNRSWLEYIFCLTPFMLRYVIDSKPCTSATYLDADIYFFSTPRDLLEEEISANAVIMSHNFPSRFRSLNRFGKYNVGWIQFYSSAVGLEALNWWAMSCLKSTSIENADDVFGDQKYLDELEENFEGIIVKSGPGENLAPWNLIGRKVKLNEGALLVDEVPLCFFHFSGMRFLKNSILLGTSHYSYRNSKDWKHQIFKEYVKVNYELSIKYAKTLPLDSRKTPKKLILKAFLLGDLISNFPMKSRLRLHRF